MAQIDDIKKRYEKKDPRVREYMNILVDSLVEQYGTVHEEWIITLDLISTNFEVYYKGYDDIIANGIYVYDKNGYKQRNSAITLQQNTQAYLYKLINSMGWNIMSKSKIKAPEKSDETDSLFED